MKFTSRIDSVSYALGYIEANNVKKQLEQSATFELDSLCKIELAKAYAKAKIGKRYMEFRKNQFDSINEDAFYKGFLNELAYGKSYFSELTADAFLRKVYMENKAIKDSLFNVKSEANLEKGRKYLEENKKRAEVKTTESGLQYEVLKEGNGPIAEKVDRVKCQYHGTLMDGKVFDSSVERGDTATFRVTGVIKGWTEALQLMPQGSKWRLYIPSELAYGQRGKGNDIGPNEVLIFDLDLVEVLKQPAKKK
ncbi:FKBP-type peptidyl-prolyl cis-trans isomerase [Puteibacter caeruleilacunae]|nr:FKBP-type peptidyl-prolyl cis-trans isomerase [Puteibacter caeruleilacunae]